MVINKTWHKTSLRILLAVALLASAMMAAACNPGPTPTIPPQLAVASPTLAASPVRVTSTAGPTATGSRSTSVPATLVPPSLTPGTRLVPHFVNHLQPALTVDFSPFENAGCPPDKNGNRVCEPASPLAALGCGEIRKPSDLLGALQPSYPIALCYVEPYRNAKTAAATTQQILNDKSFIYRLGGRVQIFVRYAIFRNNQFQIIKTPAEFASVYAPVESADEALSYVLAVQGLSAYYGLKYDPKLTYFVDPMEDTHAEQATGGYSVRLYDYNKLGCGPHYTYAVNLLVTPQGDIQETGRKQAYKNPGVDTLCVD